MGMGRLPSISWKKPRGTEGRGQDEGEKQRQMLRGGEGVGGRKTNSDKPRQEREELREMEGRLIRVGKATRMIGRLGEKLREMS